MEAAEILVAILAIVGTVGLAVGIRGSLRRDATFAERYAAASAEERPQLDAMKPSSFSWPWLAAHVTNRWGVAIWGGCVLIALAIVLARWHGIDV
jgi:hypothetical protein